MQTINRKKNETTLNTDETTLKSVNCNNQCSPKFKESIQHRNLHLCPAQSGREDLLYEPFWSEIRWEFSPFDLELDVCFMVSRSYENRQ